MSAQEPTKPDTAPSSAKTAARPNSKWAHGNRLNQKGYEQPKGFARGARVK